LQRNHGVLGANEDDGDSQIIRQKLQQIQGCPQFPVASCQQVMDLINNQHPRRYLPKKLSGRLLERGKPGCSIERRPPLEKQ
jgi:hypothetical protein